MTKSFPYLDDSPALSAARTAAQEAVPAVVLFADDFHAFTYEQVSQRLGVSQSTVEREVARGELREKRIGRAVRITASSLRRYLDGGAE